MSDADPSVSFHNVAYLERLQSGVTGQVLRRFPESVRFDPALSEIGRHFTAHTSNGSEIRFFAKHSLVRVDLSTTIEEATISIFRGEYEYTPSPVKIRGGMVSRIALKFDAHTERRDAFAGDRFSPDMWRILCHDAPIIFCGMEPGDGKPRPPSTGEGPTIRWLAYGSSITQCGDGPTSYVNIAAQELGVDALNLGMGGSCYMERSVADFIAGRSDWDFATLELGINVLPHWSEEKFADAALAFVRRIHEARPNRPVVLISHFRNGWDYSADGENSLFIRNRRYREILQEIKERINSPKVWFLNGLEIFSDLRGFNADLLHPMPQAHVRGGCRLAQMLRPVLETLRCDGVYSG